MRDSGHVLVKCMAIPPAPSAPPTSVSVSALNSTAIWVQWGPVPCIDQNGDITGYSVQFRSETVPVPRIPRIFVISGLMSSTTYSIQLAAETSTGTGRYSAVMNQLTAGIIKYFMQICICCYFLFSQLQHQ